MSIISLTRGEESYGVPDRLPVLPLREVVVFPYMVVPLLVGRPGSLGAIEAALADDRWVFLVAQRDGDVQEPAAADLYRVGVVGRVLQISRMANGTTKVLLEGVARARVTRYSPNDMFLRATIAPLPFAVGMPESVGEVAPAVASNGGAATEAGEDALARRVSALFEEYVSLHRRLPGEVVALVQGSEARERQVFAVAAHMLIRTEQRQQLLESDSMRALLERLSGILSAEIEILRLERKIESDVRGSLFQNQREFYLQEQLKAIHRELGQGDGDDLDELEATLAKKALPEHARERAEREMRKLRRTPTLSPEYTVVRNYLDWVVALPWSERTDDVLDVAHAQRVLDEDHFGLHDVKDRILDYIAVLALVGKLEGPILCLVGPPGVGKTSLGRSIARALGREFARMSLGGVRDEAEIRGHRRTYIGALPGRVLQAMRKAKVVNPVILLDEVDKMGQDWRGDPAAALLEVLDPEQNRAFNDHYLEVDYDLSQTLFITTANSLGQIPEPLRDRMEIIRLPGYVDHEKYAIARRYLIPRQLEQHGLDPAKVSITPEAVAAIARGYTREAGVRELERKLARVARKLARRASAASTTADVRHPHAPSRHPHAPCRHPRESGDPGSVTVDVADIPELLGVAPFEDEASTLEDRVGVATGLAYTNTGGDLLEIEIAVVRGRGRLQLTGTLGDVLKESAGAALTYARSRAQMLGIDPEFARGRDIHIHIPAGATPKDGPSAGIAIATALVSALTGVPVRGDTAMTGEVTLRGRVLPIGGLKEKLVAARRSGITRVIIPRANARELSEVSDDIRGGLEFHPVATMDEVLAVALRGAPSEASLAAAAEEITH
ncbi:MAG TPA: endopeptidase La [Gemmatimonadaceae bacterium]|nr:endopeptidase La [Gemmatimonadaceae bacterium]